MSYTYSNIEDLLEMAETLDAEDIQTLLDVQTVYRKRKAQPVDVEQRLRMFHETHQTPELNDDHTQQASELHAGNAQQASELHAGNAQHASALHKQTAADIRTGRSKKPSNGSRSRRTFIYYALAAAAVFVGALLFLHKPSVGTTEEGTIFTADNEQAGISLTNEQGEQLVLSAATQQNSSISLDDFRRIFSDEKHLEKMTLSVPFGKSTDITLPDGSIVYLHPGSRLVFPATFEGDQRVVKLEGEAYFKVAKDASHPFVVMTEHFETTVLGTEFNIKTGNSEQGTAAELTLVSGSVAFKSNSLKPVVNSDDQRVVLKPGQQLSFLNDQLTLNEVDVQPYELWRDGYLYYDNVELKDIMEAIGKNFNMTVEFRNTEAMHYKMRFITERNHGVDAAIDMMNRMKKVAVRKEGNKIVVD